MGNNAPDYENLAFPPRQDDELGQALIKAIQKHQRLEDDLKTIKKIIHSKRTKDAKIIAIYELVRGVR